MGDYIKYKKGLIERILPSLILIFGVLFLNSCRNDDIKLPDGENEEENLETVTFSLLLETGIETRDDVPPPSPETDYSKYFLGDTDICRGTEINTIFYKPFELDEEGKIIETDEEISSVSVFSIENTSISLKLDRTKSYRILFWAQHCDNGIETFTSPYSLSERNMEVTVDYGVVLNNDERLDAFYANHAYNWKEGITGRVVQLHRPFAQVNVGSIIADWLPSGFYNKKSVSSQMTISNVATKFSIDSGKVVDATSAYDVTFKFKNIFFGPTQDLEYMEPEEVNKLNFKRSFLYVDFNENNKIDPSPTTDVDADGEEKENISGGEYVNTVEWWRYERSRYISMAYFLVDNPDFLTVASDVVDVRFEIGYNTEDNPQAENNEFVMPFHEMVFDNVAVRPNFRTNIVGSLFSKQQRIYVNLSPVFNGWFVNNPDDFDNEFDQVTPQPEILESVEIMDQSGFSDLISAFYSDNQETINSLFEEYGYQDSNYFVLSKNVDNTANNGLQIRWDYVLYGNGNTVKLKSYSSDRFEGKTYYSIGPVRHIYITDANGNNRIYIDDIGYIWVPDPKNGGELVNTWNRLPDIDGSQGRKSYDIGVSKGEIFTSNYYPPNYN